MKARVDVAKCDGFGACNVHLPEVFMLDEWGYAYVPNGGAVPDGKEDLARRAVVDCPVHAIRIRDE